MLYLETIKNDIKSLDLKSLFLEHIADKCYYKTAHLVHDILEVYDISFFSKNYPEIKKHLIFKLKHVTRWAINKNILEKYSPNTYKINPI